MNTEVGTKIPWTIGQSPIAMGSTQAGSLNRVPPRRFSSVPHGTGSSSKIRCTMDSAVFSSASAS
jgi:hypothetical protein